MTTLLHLDSSARRASVSREVGDAFADAWRRANPSGRHVHRDLAAEPVPFIGEAWTELCDYVLANQITDIGRYKEAVRTPAQAEAWAVLEPLLDELVAADVVLIATPMYNFSVPASLKAWIDQVTFPKMSLAGRRFVIASARGGSYVPGAPREPYDHQERFLRDFIAGHFGVEDVAAVAAELVNSRLDPALAGRRAAHEKSYADALAAARELGGRY
ncbi:MULTISPECIES: FMN-dependent NADH-azoreductase [Actinomadura]|uniref:FMN dependent NADH:quinone oxidoreductase n=1 Tax=Actinomadura litoris TaxID=2678616 RepID=A0A7K1KXU8_9ACTN|nr:MULTISPECIES: NAD(P)H-dependent oxidoreductase [Actinomadura]MBT2209161.1 NAD(P)H-dependent oxidoreductase [Actinomadura sp. NEAU-AAG7]MUN37030.1 FMN-dependent NADH-azoreductase [Actinomadura litoris]